MDEDGVGTASVDRLCRPPGRPVDLLQGDDEP